ncbi:MAG: helix-turn-helix transcriptional regulator [Mycobacteriales bacterium]
MSPAGDRLDAPELIGREAELAALGVVLEDAARGGGCVAVVEGEAGIGKSALVAAALGRSGAGPHVFSASAEEMESHRPFGVVADAFGLHPGPGGLRAEVAALLGGMGPSARDPRELSFQVAEAIATLVEELAGLDGSLVVVEDLHWADPASLAVLHRLARSLPGRACSLVLTARPVPRRPELAKLLTELAARGAVCIRLGYLGEEASGDMVESLVGAEPGPDLLTWARKAGGNPLYLHELVGALIDAGYIERGADGLAHTISRDAPPSLIDAILGRLGFLGAKTKEALALASVLGSRFSVRHLSLLAGTSVVALGPALREGLAAGVLREEGEHLAFRHELIRDALYSEIPAGLRTGLHREAAGVLAQAGSPATTVAEHVLRSAVPGDAQALSWLTTAARQTANRDPAGAAEMWSRVLTLAMPTDTVVPEARAGRALCLMAVGRAAEGEELCRELLADGAPPGMAWALRSSLIQSLLVQGRLSDARATIDQTLTSESLSEIERGRLLSWSSQLHFFGTDLDGAEELARRAEAAGVLTADGPTLARASLTLAQVASSRACLGQAKELAAQAVAVTEADGSAEVYEGHAYRLAHALILADADDMEGAARVAALGRAAAESVGSELGLLFAHWADAYTGFFSGRWDDAIAELDAAARLGGGAGTGWQTGFACLDCLVVLYRQGPQAASRALARAEALLRAGGKEYRMGWVARVRATCQNALGQSGPALRVLRATWEACESAGMAIEYRLLGPDLTTLAVNAGDGVLAARVVAALEVLSSTNPEVASLRGAALRARGLIDGDPDGLLCAVEAYRRSPRRPEYAATAADAALVLARAGRSEEAAASAGEAFGVWSEMGAEWQAARARAQWRRAGIRLGARGPRRRPVSGWQALTPTEARVASLVARRLGNAEIGEEMYISKRTVESHVSHILAKVAVSSRAELISRWAAAQEAGQVGGGL